MSAALFSVATAVTASFQIGVLCSVAFEPLNLVFLESMDTVTNGNLIAIYVIVK